ncbi:MAG: hypothetical protein WBM14_00265 [Terracidiphilus sp.]
MKPVGWALILLLAALPAWAAREITVGQLEDLLRSLHQDKKSDAEVATALKQVQLTEELTVTTMNSLIRFVPGPLSTEQIYVLEARSADLIPPAADLPATPTPDAAAQHAILARAANYVTKTFDQLPALTATRTTLRFQDNVEAVAASSGISGSARDVVTSPGFSNPAAFIHYINSSAAEVLSDHGAEKLPAEKEKIPWGANKMIALEESDPSLGVVFREAQAAGTIQWLRWELVNGKQTAVYSFTVPKKKSRLAVNVCCFPKVSQAGIATFYTATTAATLGGGASGGGVSGNFQTNTDWHNYKAAVPYHGEFFIDPNTGIIVRMITEAELNPAEVVHQVDTRIDYGPVKVGDTMVVAPVKTIINTEVVPNGDSGAGRYSTRRTLFTSEYKDYRPSDAK